MNKFGFNDEWVSTLSLPQFKDWAAQNTGKHEMSDTDIESYWNSLNPGKKEKPAKATKATVNTAANDNGGNESQDNKHAK